MLGFTWHELVGQIVGGAIGGCASWAIGLWFYRKAGKDLDETGVKLVLLLEQIGARAAWNPEGGFDGARNTRCVPQSVALGEEPRST